MSQLREEDKHFLGSDAALVAVGERETLLIAAVLGFEPAATAVVGVRGGCQHGWIGRLGRLGQTGNMKQSGVVERDDQRVYHQPPFSLGVRMAIWRVDMA